MHWQNNTHEKITQIYDKTKKSSEAGDCNGSRSCWGSLEKGKAEPECIWLTSALASYECQCHEDKKKSSSKSSKSVFTLTTYSWEIWNCTKKAVEAENWMKHSWCALLVRTKEKNQSHTKITP